MLCDTCQRKKTCLPLALAQTDASMLHQLGALQHCDLQRAHKYELIQLAETACHRLKNLLLFFTSSVYHRFLVDSG